MQVHIDNDIMIIHLNVNILFPRFEEYLSTISKEQHQRSERNINKEKIITLNLLVCITNSARFPLLFSCVSLLKAS